MAGWSKEPGPQRGLLGVATVKEPIPRFASLGPRPVVSQRRGCPVFK